MVTLTPRQTTAVFKAIADPTRREILGMLRRGQPSVGEIARHFRTSRPAISKHIRQLRLAGLVATRKRGTARICELRAAALRPVSDWLRDYEVFWNRNLRSLKQFVEEQP